MSKKVERAVHGPGWVEIILGIVLSLVLGVVLGAALMILRPVAQVKELPKEPDAKVIYFIEGSRDGAKAKQAPAKRAAFAKGQTVSVSEDELNSFAPPLPPPPAAGKKAAAPPPPPQPAPGAKAAPPPKAVQPGPPNFRIREGEVQLAVPVTIDATGQRIIVQGRGGFAKEGDKFVFVPNTLYLGSLPVQNIPFLSGFVRDNLLVIDPVPEDLAAAWPKLTNVTVEGNLLTLATQ